MAVISFSIHRVLRPRTARLQLARLMGIRTIAAKRQIDKVVFTQGASALMPVMTIPSRKLITQPRTAPTATLLRS